MVMERGSEVPKLIPEKRAVYGSREVEISMGVQINWVPGTIEATATAPEVDRSDARETATTKFCPEIRDVKSRAMDVSEVIVLVASVAPDNTVTLVSPGTNAPEYVKPEPVTVNPVAYSDSWVAPGVTLGVAGARVGLARYAWNSAKAPHDGFGPFDGYASRISSRTAFTGIG
jgi:hypothetical protein